MEQCAYSRLADLYEAAGGPVVQRDGETFREAHHRVLAAFGVSRCEAGTCWSCDGTEPPMALMPDPDAPPARYMREIAAGEAIAVAALAVHERGDVEDPYALMEQWS